MWKLLPLVLIKSFKSCSQSTVSQKNYLGSHFLPFHLFNFLTFIFFKVFSSSFQSMFRGLISDIGGRSCCQITLYILHFAWFPIPIFKFNFAIPSFGNFLRNVQLEWFHFKYLSHTTKSVIMAINFWQTYNWNERLTTVNATHFGLLF